MIDNQYNHTTIIQSSTNHYRNDNKTLECEEEYMGSMIIRYRSMIELIINHFDPLVSVY